MQSNDLKTFFQNLGLITLYSQCIECDLKKIYAGMANGDFQINLGEVEEATLGQTVSMLEALDNEDNAPYFSAHDYEVLYAVNCRRNFWTHYLAREIAYLSGQEQLKKFAKLAKDLEFDLEFFARYRVYIEKVRFDVLKKYGVIKD